jgi:hypothetical protein
MAQRPIFIADTTNQQVREPLVEFKWVPGMARSQAQKCIRSLHEAAAKQHGVTRILEISSKSEEPDGVALSAFNLRLDIDGHKRPLECVYQASKKFSSGGPYVDLLDASPGDAKRDERLKSSGAIVGFQRDETFWELTPETAFYDWLYISALAQQPKLVEKVSSYDAFTDIAFNPKKSLSCQARSAALFAVLSASGALQEARSSQSAFLQHHARLLGGPEPSATLFG